MFWIVGASAFACVWIAFLARRNVNEASRLIAASHATAERAIRFGIAVEAENHRLRTALREIAKQQPDGVAATCILTARHALGPDDGGPLADDEGFL